MTNRRTLTMRDGGTFSVRMLQQLNRNRALILFHQLPSAPKMIVPDEMLTKPEPK